MQAEATVLGYLQDGVVRQARMMVLPGTPVHTAPDALLRAFFSRDEASSITLGTLINRRGVDVRLDPNGLSRHLAIIAQTGAGKSYLAGKLLEDLLGLGATIVVLDPNSDYVQLRKAQADADLSVSPRDQDATRGPHRHSARPRYRRTTVSQTSLSAPRRITPFGLPSWMPTTSPTSPACPRRPRASATRLRNR